MGIYTINCSNCKKPFQWFSGRTVDQTCGKCSPERIPFKIEVSVQYHNNGAEIDCYALRRAVHCNFYSDLEAQQHATELLKNALEEAKLRNLKIYSMTTNVFRE